MYDRNHVAGKDDRINCGTLTIVEKFLMGSLARLAALTALLAFAGSGAAFAQNAPAMPPMTPAQMQRMQPHPMARAGYPGASAGATMPTLPGQGAFGAIQEIVRILDADPKTDWSKVNLEALRQHLIDMNEVTLKADESPKKIDGGLQIAVTGSGRTLVAIRRMIPEWARMANGLNGWSAKAAPLPNGELLTVTATTPREIAHIRGLGFIGLLASGAWHQPHHLAMARGEFMPMH
jgi:hypothetical protein